MYPTEVAYEYIKNLEEHKHVSAKWLGEALQSHRTELKGLGKEIEDLEFVPLNIVRRIVDLNYIYDNLQKMYLKKAHEERTRL